MEAEGRSALARRWEEKGWGGWGDRKTDAEGMELKEVYSVWLQWGHWLSTAVGTGVCLGPPGSWSIWTRGSEKVSREPTRTAVKSRVGEKSEQPHGSLQQHSRLHEWEKQEGALGMALLQMGRWVQQSPLAGRKHTWVSGTWGQKQEKAGFISTMPYPCPDGLPSVLFEFPFMVFHWSIGPAWLSASSFPYPHSWNHLVSRYRISLIPRS